MDDRTERARRPDAEGFFVTFAGFVFFVSKGAVGRMAGSGEARDLGYNTVLRRAAPKDHEV
jgi:hypothetical protein